MDRIKAIPRQLVGRREDVIMWKLSKDGKFSTKSAYAWLNRPQRSMLLSKGSGYGRLTLCQKLLIFSGYVCIIAC